VSETFARNELLRESNQNALRLGYNYAKENFECPLPFRVEPMDATQDSILIDGNTAAALGCLYAGATVSGWYPITPATAVMDNFTRLCAQYRRETVENPLPGEPPYKNNYLIIQAEDEIAAIGMVLGASWSGARAFTSTSGPGISLMNELLGLAYYTEIPAVLIDVQRTGPSTGMPTRTQQSDILLCAYASHGDTKHILLFPANPKECFEFAVQCFDIAERFQTPVFMLSDLDIGMNDWVVPEFTWDDSYVPDRGRVLDDKDLAEMAEFFRYTNEDAEFVTPRTLPGSDSKGAYFIRGSGHDKYGIYTEDADKYQEVVDRLKKKHASAATHVPAPIVERHDGATVGIITLGGCDLAVREAVVELAESGVVADFMRVRGFPFVPQVRQFVEEHDYCFVVEQNRDAQLRSLISIETGAAIEKMHSVLAYGGFPLSARQVVDGVTSQLEN
jgi:2-oxoglutarate ferredoxin oxidoreductase subunit alpha